MVWVTTSRVVSITETVSELVSVTKATPLAAWIAVGCRPVAMLDTAAAGFLVLITLTVPVVDDAVVWSATIGVP